MAKLGVITDGISRDFEHALQVLTDAGLNYAELQFLWEKEVGDLNDEEMAKAKGLIDKYGVEVSCISRHNFVGTNPHIRPSFCSAQIVREQHLVKFFHFYFTQTARRESSDDDARDNRASFRVCGVLGECGPRAA